MLESGDAVVGINPVADNVDTVELLLQMLDRLRQTYRIPMQSCVLAHVTTQLEALRRVRARGPRVSIDRRNGWPPTRRSA